MVKIMVVDDDEYICELITTLLKNDGFQVCQASNGRDALSKADAESPNLYIVDVMMPQMDGFELCRHLRKYYKDVPVLMLTAKAALADKVTGFELGADDYLTKPFEPQELILRVKALLRRSNASNSESIAVGLLTVDKSSSCVRFGSEQADIPMKEFELLWKLASSLGKTLSRDTLIEDIWGYDFEGNERTLDVHINRLRERFPSEQYFFKITTVRGLGYRLEVIANE
jgi:DNA-binding response OmpR family regulator